MVCFKGKAILRTRRNGHNLLVGAAAGLVQSEGERKNEVENWNEPTP